MRLGFATYRSGARIIGKATNSIFRADKPTREFPITLTVDRRVKVTVVLLLKAGVEVAVKKIKTEPERPKLVG